MCFFGHTHVPVAFIRDEDPLMPNPLHAPVLVGIDGSPASELASRVPGGTVRARLPGPAAGVFATVTFTESPLLAPVPETEALTLPDATAAPRVIV